MEIMIVAKTKLKKIPEKCLKCKFCIDTGKIVHKAGCAENHWIANCCRQKRCLLTGAEVPYVYNKEKGTWEYTKCKTCPLIENLAPKNGEWLVADTLCKDEDGTWSSYSCSECGYTTESYYRDPNDISKFCPNCGVRMFMRMTHTCPHNIPNLIPTIEELLKGGEE